MSRIAGEPGFVVNRSSTNQRIQIRLYEDTPTPSVLTAATLLQLSITDLAGAVVYTDDFITPPTPPGAPSRIVNPSLGTYYFPVGDPSRFPLTPGGPANQETLADRSLLFTWYGIGTAGSTPSTLRQLVEVVGPQAQFYTMLLREYLDKTRMRVNLDPQTGITRLGFTDFQIMQYLYAGLTVINAYPPYPTFLSLEMWPTAFQWTLMEASLVAGLTAQSIYAIANDIPNWSDQGNAFVIDHFPKLKDMLNGLTQKLDVEVPRLKFQHFVGGPSGKVEAGPNARLNALIQMSPNGALFRSLIFR